MLKITAQNIYGDSIQLTQNSSLRVTVAGLNPPTGTVYTADLATKDGSIYNSAKANNRNIVLTIYPQGFNVEAIRLSLYRVFKIAKYIKLTIENNSRKATIEGYIDNIDGDLFEAPQALQVSIINPDPFFVAYAPTTAAVATAATDVTVANNGDMETGAVFTITATGAASGITITNSTTGKSFGIDVDLSTGDVLTLNTKRGEKALLLTISGGTPENILNLMTEGSSWPMLQPGNNAIQFTADSGGTNLSMTVTFSALYEGM